MNNDDLHLNKIIQQFDNSMQNINNSSNQNDDNCMELLDKITFDDSTSNFTPSSSSWNVQNSNYIEIKDDDKYCQEIMSALEKKDFTRILTLAISQSQNGHKVNGLLSETIQEIEKSSNKQVDVKIIEKLHSLLRSQPKTIGATPLRATVAPIRNESIMCSSSSNISNNSGFRTNKSTVTKSESGVSSTDDFMSFISSDCKLPSGTRSLPATPAIAQIPNRPLSSHCVPIRSNEQRKPQRLDCDLDTPQSIQPQIPFYGSQAPQMQYLPLNMSQFAQYPSSLMAPNIVLMPMMNSQQPSPGDQSQNVSATHSMAQSSALAMSQTGQPNTVNQNATNTPNSLNQNATNTNNSNNNQISLLLSSAAFFGMPNNQQPINNQVTVTTSHDTSGLGLGTNTMTSVRSPAIAPHGSSSNLPKLLPKPQQPIIMPRNMQQYSHQITQSHQPIHASSAQHNQQFKRPTNRKSAGVKTRNTSKSAKNSGAAVATSAKKDQCNTNKDNVAVAWEIAEQSASTDDMIIQHHPHQQHHQASSLSTSSATSFVTELTSLTPDEFCLIQQPGTTGLVASADPLDLFGTDDAHLTESTTGVMGTTMTNEFDDLFDDLVMMSCDNICYGRLEVQETHYETCLSRLDPVQVCHGAVVMVGGDVLESFAAVSKRSIPSSNCITIARQSPLNFEDTNQMIRPGNVDSQRVMQLLYAHFGRHNATLLSPLLKCLLPPMGPSGPGSGGGGGGGGTGGVSLSGDCLPHQSNQHQQPLHHHHQQSGPLSVCTRLSEQDDMTEDDLLADISPVKRDPSHLANLDRFLESCQSISPCNSLHDYCDDSSSFEQPHKLMMMMMPYQSMVARNNASPSLTLQDFCAPTNDRNSISWLRKSKQLRKWSLNGTVIRCSKVLELPAVQLSDHLNHQETQFVKGSMLRKKSSFKKLAHGCSTMKEKINKKSRREKLTKKYLEKIRDIKHVLHGNEDLVTRTNVVERQLRQKQNNNGLVMAHGERQNFPSLSLEKNVIISLKETASIGNDLRSHKPNIDSSNTSERLKMRISVSKLKVVQHTVAVTAADDSAANDNHQHETPLIVQPSLPANKTTIKAQRRTKVKQKINNNKNSNITTTVSSFIATTISTATRTVTGTSTGTGTINSVGTTASGAAQRQFKKHVEFNTKRIFCTRKEDRRSSALVPINASPTKHRKTSSPYKAKRFKPASTISSTTAAVTTVAEHPPLILKLKTKKIQSDTQILAAAEDVDEEDPEDEDEVEDEDEDDEEPEEEEDERGLGRGERGRIRENAENMLVSSNMAVNLQTPLLQTSGNLKLRLKRSQDEDVYQKTTSNQDFSMTMMEPMETVGFEFNKVVTLAPPVPVRSRPQLAALQFSPTHSSSDSDVDVAQNEINSLLQRQEQRDPITSSSSSTCAANGQNVEMMVGKQGRHHGQNHRTQHHGLAFPQLPVPYLVGSDPTVFIDPHECDLIIVKNSKYKKVSSQRETVAELTETGTGTVNIISEPTNNEVFVPGCFMEEEKSSHANQTWNSHSSPSMPVLAPQEPFSGTDDTTGKAPVHISLNTTYDYSNNSAVIVTQQSQSYSDSSEHLQQQSPLCMTTSTNPLHNSQYSASHKDMRPDPIKSPYGHSNYYHQSSYNSSCYLQDNSLSNPVIQSSSKNQIHSSPVASLQTTPCSSHIQDYSPYFQNNLLASADNNSFSSLSLASSSVYQQPPHHQITEHHQASKHSNTSKRSNSSRSHISEQQQQHVGSAPQSGVVSSKKQRKDSQQSSQQQTPSASTGATSLQLGSGSVYVGNSHSNSNKSTEIYQTAAAAAVAAAAASSQYSSHFDYYNGFNDIFNGIDRKFYEQWTSTTLNHLCPTNLPWMAEYCKQAAVGAGIGGGGVGSGSFKSSSASSGAGGASSVTSSGFGFSANSNPLSLTTSVTSTNHLHSVGIGGVGGSVGSVSGGGAGLIGGATGIGSLGGIVAGGASSSDYSNELTHSVDSLKPLPYLDPYYAYAYMNNPFGIPK